MTIPAIQGSRVQMLKIDNLSFGFRHRSLFKNLNAQVGPGQMLHIKGSNGTGKSTLVSLIAGLMLPLTGEVEYLVDSKAVDDRREFIEYLPAESNALFQKLTAVDNLKYWSSLRCRDIFESDLVEALKVWELDSPIIRNSLSVDKFSTGMKRRLSLARLSLAKVPCWLLDEPFYGLDEKAIIIFKNQMSTHLKNGGSIAIVSHETTPIADLITDSLLLGGPS